MTSMSQYYNDGFLFGKFEGPVHRRMMTVLGELFSAQMREGFRWEQKYPNTLDLRPNAHQYDQSFIDVLFEAHVPIALDRVVGPDMVLFHTQVRLSFPGPSYMDWHRDSYNYGKPVGNFPPAHKVIFYPLLEGVTSGSKLHLCKGSHLRHFDNKRDDEACLDSLPIEGLNASYNEFLMFNTSILHAAVADTAPSIRVIYSFLRRRQFEELYADQEIHAEQVRLYEEML